MQEELTGAQFAALAVLALLSLAVLWKLRWFAKRECRRFRIPTFSIWVLLVAVVLFVMLPLVALVTAMVLNQVLGLSEQLINGYATTAGMFATAFVMLGLWRVADPDGALWRLGADRPVRASVIQGLILGLLLLPVMLLITQTISYVVSVLYPSEMADQAAVRFIRDSMDQPWLLVTALLGVSLAAPITEEILFRGLFYPFVRARLSYVATNFTVSLFFAWMHFAPSQGTTNVSIVPALFCFAWVLGYFREHEGSLWTPIAAHAAFNSGTVLLLVMGVV